jgi:hypothetical protein
MDIENPAGPAVSIAEWMDRFKLQVSDSHFNEWIRNHGFIIVQERNQVIQFGFEYAVPPWWGINNLPGLYPTATLADNRRKEWWTDVIGGLCDFLIHPGEIIPVEPPILPQVSHSGP